MRKKSKYILAVLAAATSMAYGQYGNDIQVRPNPFGGGYNVYDQQGVLRQTIRPNPFGGGYNGYDSHGTWRFESRPNPFGGGYNIHTMPRNGYYR